MPTLSLPQDELNSIVWEEHPDFEQIAQIFVEHARWAVVFRLIVKQISTGKYYSLTDHTPATESQDDGGIRGHGPLIEVEPTRKVHTVYEVIR
jgi:hypothetical protein